LRVFCGVFDSNKIQSQAWAKTAQRIAPRRTDHDGFEQRSTRDFRPAPAAHHEMRINTQSVLLQAKPQG